MKRRAISHPSPWLYAAIFALVTAAALAVLPGAGRGQDIEQPIAGLGVFAALPAGSGAGVVTQLPDPQASIEGGPINCAKSEGKKTRPVGVCAAQIALDDPSGAAAHSHRYRGPYDLGSSGDLLSVSHSRRNDAPLSNHFRTSSPPN